MTINVDSLSLPVFAPLDWRPARTHLITSDEAGLAAVERLLAKPAPQAGERLALHVLGRESKVAALTLTDRMDVYVNPDDSSFRGNLSSSILASPRQTGLYAAGSQSFLSSVSRLARQCNLLDSAMQAELLGSGARDAQCMNCKNIYLDIDYRAFDCPRCGVTLFVGDNYSRHLGAYEAVVLHPADPNLQALRQQRLW